MTIARPDGWASEAGGGPRPSSCLSMFGGAAGQLPAVSQATEDRETHEGPGKEEDSCYNRCIHSTPSIGSTGPSLKTFHPRDDRTWDRRCDGRGPHMGMSERFYFSQSKCRADDGNWQDPAGLEQPVSAPLQGERGSPRGQTGGRKSFPGCIRIGSSHWMDGYSGERVSKTREIGAGVRSQPCSSTTGAVYATREAPGVSGEIGTMRKGARSDLVVVRGNAMQDVGCLADVLLVMKGGRIMRHEACLRAVRGWMGGPSRSRLYL